MDTLRIIREKIDILSSMVSNDGLLAVVKHLEMAESHYFNGQENNDQDLYTDVIYRTNHAFEGILKEAYALLADQGPRNRTPFQIEQYLAENNVFGPRVLDLFTQYRQQWRNPSTHEYQLFFTQQEAFLGILSVTSFVSILLDQMIEKAAYQNEKSLEATMIQEEEKPLRFYQWSLIDKVVFYLRSFNNQMQLRSSELGEQNEQQFIGRLHAFIESSLPDINIESEPVVTHEKIWYVPDFILSHQGERILLEVKTTGKPFNAIKKDLEYQMLQLMRAAGVSSGIVYVYSKGLRKETIDNQVEISHPDEKHEIVHVFPVSTGNKVDMEFETDFEYWDDDYYVSFGHEMGRHWEDARKYGFISAGGGSWYSRSLNRLSEGDRIWVNIPRTGYVGVGIVEGPAVIARDFKVMTENGELPITEAPLLLDRSEIEGYLKKYADHEERAEYFVKVRWIRDYPISEAVSEYGFFGNQHIVCKPRSSKWLATIDTLKKKWGIT